MRFSRHQIDDFQRDGFVLHRNLYHADEVATMARAIDEIAARTPTPGKEMVYLEDRQDTSNKKILSRIEKFLDFHDELKEAIFANGLAERVGELLGDKAVLFKEKINFKLPGGEGFTPHQDIQPGWDDYAPYFVSVLITIDASTVENGCLELAAGHHRRGMLGERWTPLNEQQLEGVTFEPFETKPGDAAFFDCFVPHRSAPNRSDSPRRNLYLTFNRLADGHHRERYFADKRRSYPPDCEREEGREYRFRV